MFTLSSEKEYPAHIRKDESTGNFIVQLVQEHCRNVAMLAEERVKKVGLGRTAYLAGLLHDMGKFTNEFREYIEKAVLKSEEAKRGTVNHSFAGVRYVLNQYHSDYGNDDRILYQNLTAEIIAYAIGAHHGLFDCVDCDGKNGFVHRLTKDGISYDEAVANYTAQCISAKELDRIFNEAVEELRTVIDCLNEKLPDTASDEDWYFCLGMVARLVLSAVIDSDWKDTGAFQAGENIAARNERGVDWTEPLSNMMTMLDSLPRDSEIAKARRWISDKCAERETEIGGIYRLSLPTGSGKTLTSLRFALTNALKGKSHTYFVMPLLSIIDQNAGEIRKYVGNDSLILEHHSNVVRDEDNAENEYGSFRPSLQIDWHEPIIITTLVQFLLTCFGGKSSSIRRFHSLTDSIIVLDEVQTVPAKMLSLFNLVVNFLSTIGKSVIVLCSATQPPLRETKHPLVKSEELLELPDDIKTVFKRVTIKAERPQHLNEICERVGELIQNVKSLLVVCNVKNEAKDIFRAVETMLGNIRCFHLSANMCVAHRMKVIADITEALEQVKTAPENAPRVICIATQVIEAGVDVSFECVIRLEAGMDNVVQAAGRCNRHGEMSEGAETYIIKNLDNGLQRLPEIKAAQDATENLLAYIEYHDEADKELDSRESIDRFYRNLYQSQKDGYQDFTIPEKIKPNAKSIYNLMAKNTGFVREDSEGGFVLQQALKTAGKLFTVFDDHTADVIVPYGEDGNELIADLWSERAKYDMAYARSLVRKARFYTVSVFAYQLKKLIEADALSEIKELGIYTLSPDFYSEDFGLDYEGSNNTALII